jgi:hypothetical protein
MLCRNRMVCVATSSIHRSVLLPISYPLPHSFFLPSFSFSKHDRGYAHDCGHAPLPQLLDRRAFLNNARAYGFCSPSARASVAWCEDDCCRSHHGCVRVRATCTSREKRSAKLTTQRTGNIFQKRTAEESKTKTREREREMIITTGFRKYISKDTKNQSIIHNY